MERISVSGISLEVPQELCDDPSLLLEIISPDTWNNVFSDKHREMLMHFLPDFPEDDLEEKTRTLEMFFMHENFFFGNPLQKFFTKLNGGHFNPSVSKMRKIQQKLLHKAYKFRQKKYYHNLLEEVIIRRKNHLDRARFQKLNNEKLPVRPEPLRDRDTLAKRVKKRYFKELSIVRSAADCNEDVSSDENYPEGPGFSLNKKQKRQLLLLDTSFEAHLCQVRGTHSLGSLSTDLEIGLTSSQNPFEHSDEYFKTLVARHLEKHRKNKNDLCLDTRGITLQSIMERSPLPIKKSFQRSQSGSSSISFSSKLSHSSTHMKQKKKKIRSSELFSRSHKSRSNYSHDFEASSNSSSSESEMCPTEAVKSVPLALLNIEKRGVSRSPFKAPVRNKSLDSLENNSPKSNSTHYDNKEEPDDPPDVKPIIEIKTEEPDGYETKPDITDFTSCGNLAAELTQETHISYFSLLRDVICSTTSQRMNKDQLELSVRAWQESAISPLNEWYSTCSSWVIVLPSAVNFLCGNVSGDSFSSDFVPYIEYKASLKMYQWIGAGRDSDSNLEPLSNFWLSNQDAFSSEWTCGEASIKIESEDSQSLPPPRVHTNWSVKPASDAEKEAYHIQEKQRYDKPHRAFTFRTHGYESIIGPVKGIYSEQIGNTSKARGHSLLTNDRPPYVTILSLVRDAVARLPNGEGTKSDICELLKESQFILPTIGSSAENALSSVASGALDRLQYGDDPCVKFDTARKLWVYLHRNRTEKEFERLHHIYGPTGSSKVRQQSSARKSCKIKKEDCSDNQAPPNVALEPFTPAIKQMDGSEVKVKAEDMLENWVAVSKNKLVKRGQVIRPTSTFVQTSSQQIQKAKHKPSKSEVAGLHPVTVGSAANSMLCVIKASVAQTATTQADLRAKTPEGNPVRCEEDDKQSQSSVISTFTPVLSEVVTLGSNSIAVSSGTVSKVGDKKVEKKGVIGTPTTGTAVLAAPISSDLQGTVGVNQRDHHQVRGIKVLHYPSLQSVAAKGIVGNASVIVDSNASLQALVGQKLVVSGNRVLVQGGKVLHAAAAAGNVGSASILSSSVAGKQLLTGLMPTQQIMAVTTSTRGQGSDKASQEGGRFIQIATLESGGEGGGTLKKVTFLPQLTPCRTINAAQKLPEAQTLSTLANAKGATIPLSDLKLKVGGAPATFVSTAANVLSLGGKQIILTHKGNATYAHPQIQQMIVSDANSDCSDDSAIKTATATVGPQIVLPASALQGQGINLKRLQAFQSFKVVPASQIPMHQKGKPLVAHILTTPVTQVATSPTTKNVATTTIKPPDDQLN